MSSKKNIAIIGLGYVGLPLAVEFGKKFKVIGFDINEKRIAELKKGFDNTLELESEDLKKSTNLNFTSNEKDLSDCDFYIVTVPTPIDKNKRPDLNPLLKASEIIGKVLKRGDIVVYESTVYPGCTEEDCVPILELHSGLKYNKDFYCGYSPERINPGDKLHTVTKIKKVTSGSTPFIAELIDEIYNTIIEAGTHRAPSIKVAEAAKVIENSQRDLNIAFVNELAKIFNLMNIDTKEVLSAAGSKWNFLNFSPGLVGGHCIGVDPYYLTHKALELGYHPEIILAGRKLNDSMGAFVATEVIRQMIRKGLNILNSRILILGFTFKENCPDVRNSKVIDIYNELKSYNIEIDVFDPWASAEQVEHEYGVVLLPHSEKPNLDSYSAIILAVAHNEFLDWKIRSIPKNVVYDVKGVLGINEIDKRL